MKQKGQGSINPDELLARVENDEELAHEILGIFQAQTPDYRESLRSAVGKQSVEETRQAAHAFKGMLANLAATRASALAAHLEQLAKDQRVADFQTAWQAFDEELTKVLKDAELLLAGAAK